jgi:2-polyprenyl-3-methyl-5-hydroxy-6-metoxy-1,4-benzoquinol methylase
MMTLFKDQLVKSNGHHETQTVLNSYSDKESFSVMKEKYDSEAYWEQRLSNKLDLTTVGQMGLGYVYNSWLYRARFHTMHRALRKLNLNISSKSLIEVGVGSGAWIPYWQKHNISKIVGLDITSASVCALVNRYPEYRFIKADICSTTKIPSEETFDIVTALDVLFHITNDSDFSNGILNLSKLVKRGGWLILSDSFCKESWGPFYHEYHRTYDTYLREFNSVCLKPIHIEPIFYTMTTNICNSDSRYQRFISQFTKAMLNIVSRLSSQPQTEWMNHLIGCSMYLIDRILYRIEKTGFSLKLLFVQKC